MQPEQTFNIPNNNITKICFIHRRDWRNRRGLGAGAEYPMTFFTGKFLLTYLPGKKGARKRGKMERKRRKVWKGGGGTLKKEGEKVWKWAEDFFFFLACYYLKPLNFKLLNFVWGLPNWTILIGKNHILRREKIGKTDFVPSEKYSSYATDKRPVSTELQINHNFISKLCPDSHIQKGKLWRRSQFK